MNTYRNRIFRLLTAAILTIVLQGTSWSGQGSEGLESKIKMLSTFIEENLEMQNIPGLSISVVKDGEIIFAQGFGKRDVENNLPVTENTLFAIGSATKPFTTMILGMLVDDGLLDWNGKIVEYLPAFKMWDEFATEEMTVTDLITHRSGLPRHDLMWYGSKFTREELFDRLQYLQPVKGFREKFQYQNLMFMAAGYLSGKIAGKKWEELVAERIFKPLSMKNSNFSEDEMMASADYSLPYEIKNNNFVKMGFVDITEMGPAGSINSNSVDMANWLKFLLNNGSSGENQLISDLNLKLMQTPVIPTNMPSRYGDLTNQTYGLGWIIETYRGYKRVQHGGIIEGFTSQISFFPKKNVGIAVLSNKNRAEFPNILSLYASDLFLDLEPTNRIKSTTKSPAANPSNSKIARPKRVEDTNLSHELDNYTGDFEHPGYGKISIYEKNNALHLKYNAFDTPIIHWHYDSFMINEGLIKDILVSFYTNIGGDIHQLSARLEPSIDPLIFKRVYDSEILPVSSLEKFIGTFVLGTQEIIFKLKGNILTAIIAGQPPYTMEAINETEFNIKQLNGYTVKFFVEEQDRVDKAEFRQPNGVFIVKRKK